MANAARVHGIELGLDVASFESSGLCGGGAFARARIAESLAFRRVIVSSKMQALGSGRWFLAISVAF